MFGQWHLPHFKLLVPFFPTFFSEWESEKVKIWESKKLKTRTNCSRKVREIESGPWQRWLGWRGWRMIICKRLRMVFCKRLVPPYDHLQEAGSSIWSFARGRIPCMIFCKRPDPPDDHLQQRQRQLQLEKNIQDFKIISPSRFWTWTMQHWAGTNGSV